MTTVIETFAAFGARFHEAPTDAALLHHARRAVVDFYAAMLPGAVEAPAKLLEQVYASETGHGKARLATGATTNARVAAMVNGTAAHTVEVDDIFKDAIYHPGAPVIAAALAVAEETGASGLRFLQAVIVGYEVSTRIGAALGRRHYKFWHNTGTVGTFGAAAAAASLYGLDATRFAHALATCATFASGLQQAFRMDSMSKPMHAGHAAECGVSSAQMARAGIIGSLDVLDGEAGLGKAMSDGPDWTKAVATLGREFNVARMTFKNHACCGHTFSPIDAALQLQQQLGAKAADIEQVTVATYSPALDVAGNPSPKTAAEARFSLPFVVATALLHGSVRLAAFSDARLADPAIRALMARIRLEVEPTLDAAFPGQRAARVEMVLKNGERASYTQPHRKGDPELPLTDEDLGAKFRELAEPVMGPAAAGALLAQLWKLEAAAGMPAIQLKEPS